MKASTEELLEYAWLQLGDLEGVDLSKHPFRTRKKSDVENPALEVLRLMRKPEYFPFTCKHVLNVEILPFQHVVLKELWRRAFPMLIASRGASKSWIMALYSILRGLFSQGSKVIIVGAAFRQSKVEFEYCENFWANAPVLRDIVGAGKGRNNRDNGPRRDIDRCELIIGESIVTALPLGDGQRIRGQRATHTLATEFASIPVAIFETVVAGFGVVSGSPAQNVKAAARIRKLKELGLWSEEQEEERRKTLRGNQIVLGGTAYYDFNHFAQYWKRYKAIVESKGEPKKLAEIFNGEVPDNFDWRDYSVIRLPIELVPEDFMDMKQVIRSKVTISNNIYLCEYSAVFVKDSDGFFRRTLIESCVVGKPDKPIVLPSGEVNFHVQMRGVPGVEHIFGVDPASERDNFSVVIVSLHPDHRRIVYCWTTTRAVYKKRLKAKLTSEHDFYAYCAKKIRELMRLFPCKRILMDSQGGGVAVMEAFQDPDKVPQGEMPVYEVPDPDPTKFKETDGKPGWHILEMVQFARADWTSEANHGMKKDFGDKVLLFPHFDPISVGEAIEADKESGRVVLQGEDEVAMHDTLEDAVMEIEELKDELANIVHTQTSGSGREHWDTPEVKLAGSKKGRARKDRYSALLMANMGARQSARAVPPPAYEPQGGWGHQRANLKQPGAMYVGPEWFTRGYAGANSGNAGAVVRRRP